MMVVRVYKLERELEDDAWSEPRENGGDPGEVLRLSPHPTVNLAVRPFVGDARPKCGNDRSCVECLVVGPSADSLRALRITVPRNHFSR